MSCKVSKSATVILTKLLNKVGTRNFRTRMNAPSPKALRIFIGPHSYFNNCAVKPFISMCYLPICRLIQKTGAKSYNGTRFGEGLQISHNVVLL